MKNKSRNLKPVLRNWKKKFLPRLPANMVKCPIPEEARGRWIGRYVVELHRPLVIAAILLAEAETFIQALMSQRRMEKLFARLTGARLFWRDGGTATGKQ